MTPVRQQYLRIKKQYPDVIVFFRLGDFYETFEDDAKIVSEVCNIVLTGREMGAGTRVPLAGVPYHAVETYLAKLIQAGHKVAIVDQLETPEQARQNHSTGPLARQVTRIVTAGTVVEPALLSDKSNNYLAAVCVEGGHAGIAYADITTGECAATEVDSIELRNELDRLRPAEVLTAQPLVAGETVGYPSSHVKPIDHEGAVQILLEQFQVDSLDGFGLADLKLATRAAGMIVRYLGENQKSALTQLRAIRVYASGEFMVLDPPTRRNLELAASIRAGGVKGSLLRVIDETKTAMGGRLLRRWLMQPLRDVAALDKRLDQVDMFYRATERRERVRAILRQMGDVERLTNRILQGIATPRDLRALRSSLELVPKLQQVLDQNRVNASLMGGGNPLLDGGHTEQATVRLEPCIEAASLIEQAIVDDPPATLGSGGVISTGYSSELDSITLATRNAKDWVASLERTERERTGIKSLKVGYNRVFGYYIEVTTSNLNQVPDNYIRKQTLTNAERYITPELKEHESLILNAEERMIELETGIFRSVCAELAGHAPRLLETARSLAELDVYSALAEVALKNRYVRPVLNEGDTIDIRGGRHPVVELALKSEPFVPNECHLSPSELIHVITGPNMSGKSVFIRQVALIVLLAQIGSFVPADSAHIGIVDRIFTRIGAEDAVGSGQSTFMVEMVETANILNHCTPKSLLLLDEIGRGTSTYDGIAIARAVVEYVHNHPGLNAKTLFATHYHELTELENYLPKVRNYNVAVVEQEEHVVFLHKIVPGGADKSYGIHVAQLAGVPRPIVSRAQEILEELENYAGSQAAPLSDSDGRTEQPIQLRLFSADDELRQELARLDVLALSPLEALNKLFELKRKATN